VILDQTAFIENIKLPQLLLEAHKEGKISSQKEKNPPQKNSTKQFLPFVYSIAESIQKISESDENFKDALGKIPGWVDFQEFLDARRQELDVPPEIEETGAIPEGFKDGSDFMDAPDLSQIKEEDQTSSRYTAGTDSDDDHFDIPDTDDIPSTDDHDDYDIEQAEIMLTKHEVQFSSWIESRAREEKFSEWIGGKNIHIHNTKRTTI